MGFSQKPPCIHIQLWNSGFGAVTIETTGPSGSVMGKHGQRNSDTVEFLKVFCVLSYHVLSFAKIYWLGICNFQMYIMLIA